MRSSVDGNQKSAIELATESFSWYRTAAIRSRRMHRGSELCVIAISAAIPVCAAAFSGNTLLSAILGALIVVIGGMRGLFHWHENYVRFSRSRELIDAERRRYQLRDYPYDDDNTRDILLARAVTRIEHDEIGEWSQLASSPARPTESLPPSTA
jgi:hypothetical protein